MFTRTTLLAVLTTLCFTAAPERARAVAPSDTLMPPTTRGFATIKDLQALSDNFSETQLGQLVEDPAMRPFVQDMKRQLQRKLSSVRDKLGLELGDLKGVATGEVGIGMIERDQARAAVLMTVDIAGRQEAAQQLLTRVDRELSRRKAQKKNVEADGVRMTVYTLPAEKPGADQLEAIFLIHGDLLIGSDSRTEILEMLGRLRGESDGGLASVKAYQVTMERVRQQADGLEPEVRWFVDPFGYARAARTLKQGDQPHGKDFLKILTEQGFDAIAGMGGFLNLSVGGAYEILHQTYVYAPPVEGAEGKYRLAMQMLKFPNDDQMRPQAWVPRKLATYRTFNVDLRAAFDHFGTLFDAIAGYDEAFAGVIEGLEVDPYGPQVKVRQDFIDHLGQRLTMATDYEVPITTESERFLFMVEVKNEQAIEAAVRKFMDADPNARETEFRGVTVWEIMEAEDEIEELQIGVVEFDPLAPGPGEANVEGGDAVVESSAVCVSDGHLIVASHLQFLQRILAEKPDDETLPAAGDYNAVQLALDQLLNQPVCARNFVRSDEAYRPTYELLRQGKMPESRTLLGRLLNRMLTPPEDEDEGILREQKIDARTLPSFEMVRRYFSPSGTLIRSEEDGWLIVGAMLSKQTGQARAPTAVGDAGRRLK